MDKILKIQRWNSRTSKAKKKLKEICYLPLIDKIVWLCKIHSTSARNATKLVYDAMFSLSVNRLIGLTSKSAAAAYDLTEMSFSKKPNWNQTINAHLVVQEPHANWCIFLCSKRKISNWKNVSYIFIFERIFNQHWQKFQFIFPKQKIDTLNLRRRRLFLSTFFGRGLSGHEILAGREYDE